MPSAISSRRFGGTTYTWSGSMGTGCVTCVTGIDARGLQNFRELAVVIGREVEDDDVG